MILNVKCCSKFSMLFFKYCLRLLVKRIIYTWTNLQILVGFGFPFLADWKTPNLSSQETKSLQQFEMASELTEFGNKWYMQRYGHTYWTWWHLYWLANKMEGPHKQPNWCGIRDSKATNSSNCCRRRGETKAGNLTCFWSWRDWGWCTIVRHICKFQELAWLAIQMLQQHYYGKIQMLIWLAASPKTY